MLSDAVILLDKYAYFKEAQKEQTITMFNISMIMYLLMVPGEEDGL